MRYFYIIAAGVFAIIALLTWFVLLRPVDTKTGQGVITHKIFKPAGQYVQYPTPTSGGFYSPNVIPIAECYVMVIQVDQLSASVGYSLNTVAAQQYEVGQRVSIQYQERGLAGIWRRVYVTGMSRATA